jgi:Mn-dependent DtxR family transcriptional regulator
MSTFCDQFVKLLEDCTDTRGLPRRFFGIFALWEQKRRRARLDFGERMCYNREKARRRGRGEEKSMERIRESGEMYLENILVLREEMGNLRAVDIARRTGYSKPSISRALGLLRADGMVLVDDDGYIALTEAGEARARKIYERHRVLTDFLIRIGVDSETADSDACRIEHVISDATFEKMKEYMQKKL